MSVSLDQVVWAFDFSRIETVGGVRYLIDGGPSGFHFAFPGGANDPTPRTDGGLQFDGGDWLDLPAAQMARFYTALPTGACTFLFSGLRTDPVAAAVLFSTDNNGAGGVWRGLFLQTFVAGETQIRQGQGGAALPSITIATARLPGRKIMLSGTCETTPRALVDQSTVASAWTVGAFGVCNYDTAIVPCIGARPGHVSGLWTGPIYYLALLKGVVSSADLSALSAQIANGGKPFCWRQT